MEQVIEKLEKTIKTRQIINGCEVNREYSHEEWKRKQAGDATVGQSKPKKAKVPTKQELYEAAVVEAAANVKNGASFEEAVNLLAKEHGKKAKDVEKDLDAALKV